MTQSKIAYFGYGSLVNLATLRTNYIAAYPARISGWSRVWLERPENIDFHDRIEDPIALLSVEPNPGTTIDGVVIVDHAANLPEIDEREAFYDRVEVPRPALTCSHDLQEALDMPVFLYAAKPGVVRRDRTVILRSYLDAVAQGFLVTFGQEGLLAFDDTTRPRDLPIFEDRENPIYPRAVTLTPEERVTIDAVFPPR